MNKLKYQTYNICSRSMKRTFYSLDWVTICIYLLLIIGGWFSVCGASYDYGDRDFLDFSTRAGKQFVWIICSFGLGFVLLMLEDRMYDM